MLFRSGSGNAGLTNFYRTFGGPLTLGVISCDVLKAILAIWIASDIVNTPSEAVNLAKYWAGLWCLLGHMFPCMFHFKGGKGILSGGTIAIMIDWRIALVVWGGFLVLAVVTRYVSLGSCWAGASFPFATWFVYQDAILLVLSIVIGGLILYTTGGLSIPRSGGRWSAATPSTPGSTPWSGLLSRRRRCSARPSGSGRGKTEL